MMRKLPHPHAGVEQPKLAQLVQEPEQCVAPAAPASFQACELRAQVVEEQWLDDLQDVLLRCVVGTLGTALRRIHHRLEQGPEDRGRNV